MLVPETETISHADGTFRDFGAYCVFTLPAGKATCHNYLEPIHEAGFEWRDEILVESDSYADSLLRYQRSLNGEMYYIDLYDPGYAEQDGELGVTIIAGKELPDWKEGWLLAGRSEAATRELIIDSLLDLDAVPSEPLEDWTVYSFEGIDVGDLQGYGSYLERGGQWQRITDEYDNPTNLQNDRYIEEFTYIYEEFRMVIAYQGRVKVITGSESLQELDEEVLWDLLDASAMPGERYIRRNCPGFLLQKATGSGYTGDIVYRRNENASAADFVSMRTELLAQGFTEDVQEYEENGQKIFTAWSPRSYCGFDFRLYTKLILEDTYLEVQVGKHADEGSHRGQ